MKQKFRKVGAFLLALCMVIGLLPISAFGAIIEDASEYITQQVLLGDDLTLRLWGDFESGYANLATASLTYGDQTDSYRFKDLIVSEDGKYGMAADLAAAQLTEDVVLSIKIGTIELIRETYTIRDYLTTLIDGEYSLATKKLSRELLNYGAWAQKYFDYRTDDLANAGYEISESTPVPGEVPQVSREGGVDGIGYYGATVRFDSKTAVRYYFQAENDVSGYTFTVDGTAYTPVSKDDLYYIEVANLNPQDMNTRMEIQVTDNTDTLTVYYTPTDYFVRNYHKTTDENFKGLMAAAYSYFLAAEEFAGIHTVGDLNLYYQSGSSNTIVLSTDLPLSTALADFKLSENGCSVDESANVYQKASYVGMAKDNRSIVLTFHFDNDFAAGQTYTLPAGSIFHFTDGTEYVLRRDYLYEFNGTAWISDQTVEDARRILGFESYQEVTGTKIAIGNMLGRMEINQDVRYISQGNGSLKVSPQGNYGDPTKHPWFKLDFMNTTCKTDNLAAYKSISFDVYNPESKEQHIRIGLTLGSNSESYVNTLKETFTVAPDGWTTCTFDLSVMAGYTMYDLENVRYMVMEFLDHKQSRDDTVNSLYIDNLIGHHYDEGQGPVDAEYAFEAGIDFEEHGDEFLFTGQGDASRDAVIERVVYDTAGISAPTDGGSYALKLSHDSDYWPTFRIYFGETMPAGTEITFQAYGKITSGTNLYNQSVFEFSAGGEATAQFPCDAWADLMMILPEDADYVDLYWNYDRAGITSATASGEVYIDNMVASKPATTAVGDFTQGVDFEERGNELLFTGQGDSKDATIQRAFYTNTGIPVPTDGGKYALKLSCTNTYWPTFRLNFGKELAAGTKISFMAYAKINGTSLYNQSIFEFSQSSGSGEATEQFPCDQWVKLVIVLPAAADHLDLYWNMDRAQVQTTGASGEVYIDNIKAVESVEPTGDFLEGIGFEEEGNEGRFVGQGVTSRDATVERVSYESLDISAPANGGSYALKLSHESNYWPTFRINFGKELEAGTTLTFMAYCKINGTSKYNYSIFEFMSGGDATSQFTCSQWTELSITLPNDAEYLDLFWNIDRAGIISSTASSELYLDNFRAAVDETPTGDFLEGIGFEEKGNELYFTGQGIENRDAALERVSYSNLGIDAPENGGSYALKLSHASNYWPTFRINFGRKLAAGTVITFMAYGKITSGTNLYNQSIFEFSSGGEATAQFKHDVWNELTITLSADAEYIDLFWNFDRASITSSSASGEVYIDNIVAVELETNFLEGIGFENTDDVQFFTGQGKYNDAAIERVSYADLGVVAPTDGGSYALKLSHASNYWPTFRINFGRKLKAGTTITFMAYGKITSGTNRYNQSIFEYSSGGEATKQFKCDVWTELTITLTSDAEYIDLFWNFDRASITSSSASGEVYIDNIIAVEP